MRSKERLKATQELSRYSIGLDEERTRKRSCEPARHESPAHSSEDSTDIGKVTNRMTTLEQERRELMAQISKNFEVHGDAPVSNSDFYKISKMIGKGAFGKVVLGIHKLTGK